MLSLEFWADNRNGNFDVYMYDFSTSQETQITTQRSAMSLNIYGDRIVWMESHNGFNMYTCIIPVDKTKATPTITWNNPDDIISGTALNSTKLNAIASVPGIFSYTPASGTVLNAGTQPLHVDFIPSDSANYTTVSKDVTTNVVAAPLKNPTITWSNPEDIISGTALSSTQLNATASVLGTFVYTPPSGTILSAGTQTLKVEFTPTDIANYNTATQTVTINVLTHVQKIQQITAEVENLHLIPEQANLLVVKLDTATKNMNAGNTNAAANELNAFINQVSADVNSGKISSTEGQTLIDEANTVINAIDSHATSVPKFPSVALPVVAVLGMIAIIGDRKD
jgi:beta propeller repeat protein